MRIKSRSFPGVRMRVNLGSNENDRRLTSCNPLDLRHWITHPELNTDDRRFGYSRFKRKLLFFRFNRATIPYPVPKQQFHCISGIAASISPRETEPFQAIRLWAPPDCAAQQERS